MTGPELPDRDHKPGCPVVLQALQGRVEQYVLPRPPVIAPETGTPIALPPAVRVTRCQDCGEAHYEDVTEEEANR